MSNNEVSVINLMFTVCNYRQNVIKSTVSEFLYRLVVFGVLESLGQGKTTAIVTARNIR